MNQLPHFITQSIDWYDGWAKRIDSWIEKWIDNFIKSC